MTTENIDKIRQQAKELGIYKIIRNIANNGDNTMTSGSSEWEHCSIKCNILEKPTENYSSRPWTTSITMPDGTILYRSEGDKADNQTVTHFRFGKWVERITAYSNELTVQRELERREKLAQKQAELLKPFSEIDF